MIRLFILILLAPLSAATQDTPPTTRRAIPDRPIPAIRRVAIISVDGLRPDALLRADAPRIKSLMDRGSFTMWARTTPQAITLPSHVSMLTGVSPSVHGIEWNSDLPLREAVYPARPTLFQLASAAGYHTAMVTGKSKFVPLAVPGSLDAIALSDTPTSSDTSVADHATKLIAEQHPDVLFVHFGNVDGVGHADGWGSQEQLAAIHVADTCVGRVLDALSEANTLESTLVILTSDHGGAGKTHGPDDPRSRTIPWIAAGPGVRQNYDLTRLGRDHDVQTQDTFATACYVLGIKPRRAVEGKPIIEIFEQRELLREAPTTRPAE